MAPNSILVSQPKRDNSCGQCVMCSKRCSPFFAMPCHVVCMPCLTQLVQYRDPADVILCPQCYAIYPFDESWRRHFMDMTGLRNDHGSMLEVRRCQRCCTHKYKPPAFAEHYCYQCRLSLCRHCNVTVHVYMTSSDERRHHVVVPMIPDSWSTLKERLVSSCRFHTGQSLSLFCVTCREMVCWDCAEFGHRGHELWDVRGNLKKYSDALHLRLTTLRDHKTVMMRLLSSLQCLTYGQTSRIHPHQQLPQHTSAADAGALNSQPLEDKEQNNGSKSAATHNKMLNRQAESVERMRGRRPNISATEASQIRNSLGLDDDDDIVYDDGVEDIYDDCVEGEGDDDAFHTPKKGSSENDDETFYTPRKEDSTAAVCSREQFDMTLYAKQVSVENPARSLKIEGETSVNGRTATKEHGVTDDKYYHVPSLQKYIGYSLLKQVPSGPNDGGGLRNVHGDSTGRRPSWNYNSLAPSVESSRFAETSADPASLSATAAAVQSPTRKLRKTGLSEKRTGKQLFLHTARNPKTAGTVTQLRPNSTGPAAEKQFRPKLLGRQKHEGIIQDRGINKVSQERKRRLFQRRNALTEQGQTNIESNIRIRRRFSNRAQDPNPDPDRNQIGEQANPASKDWKFAARLEEDYLDLGDSNFRKRRRHSNPTHLEKPSKSDGIGWKFSARKEAQQLRNVLENEERNQNENESSNINNEFRRNSYEGDRKRTKVFRRRSERKRSHDAAGDEDSISDGTDTCHKIHACATGTFTFNFCRYRRRSHNKQPKTPSKTNLDQLAESFHGSAHSQNVAFRQSVGAYVTGTLQETSCNTEMQNKTNDTAGQKDPHTDTEVDKEDLGTSDEPLPDVVSVAGLVSNTSALPNLKEGEPKDGIFTPTADGNGDKQGDASSTPNTANAVPNFLSVDARLHSVSTVYQVLEGRISRLCFDLFSDNSLICLTRLATWLNARTVMNHDFYRQLCKQFPHPIQAPPGVETNAKANSKGQENPMAKTSVASHATYQKGKSSAERPKTQPGGQPHPSYRDQPYPSYTSWSHVQLSPDDSTHCRSNVDPTPDRSQSQTSGYVNLTEEDGDTHDFETLYFGYEDYDEDGEADDYFYDADDEIPTLMFAPSTIRPCSVPASSSENDAKAPVNEGKGKDNKKIDTNIETITNIIDAFIASRSADPKEQNTNNTFTKSKNYHEDLTKLETMNKADYEREKPTKAAQEPCGRIQKTIELAEKIEEPNEPLMDLKVTSAVKDIVEAYGLSSANDAALKNHNMNVSVERSAGTMASASAGNDRSSDITPTIISYSFERSTDTMASASAGNDRLKDITPTIISYSVEASNTETENHVLCPSVTALSTPASMSSAALPAMVNKDEPALATLLESSVGVDVNTPACLSTALPVSGAAGTLMDPTEGIPGATASDMEGSTRVEEPNDATSTPSSSDEEAGCSEDRVNPNDVRNLHDEDSIRFINTEAPIGLHVFRSRTRSEAETVSSGYSSLPESDNLDRASASQVPAVIVYSLSDASSDGETGCGEVQIVVKNQVQDSNDSNDSNKRFPHSIAAASLPSDSYIEGEPSLNSQNPEDEETKKPNPTIRGLEEKNVSPSSEGSMSQTVTNSSEEDSDSKPICGDPVNQTIAAASFSEADETSQLSNASSSRGQASGIPEASNRTRSFRRQASGPPKICPVPQTFTLEEIYPYWFAADEENTALFYKTSVPDRRELIFVYPQLSQQPAGQRSWLTYFDEDEDTVDVNLESDDVPQDGGAVADDAPLDIYVLGGYITRSWANPHHRLPNTFEPN